MPKSSLISTLFRKVTTLAGSAQCGRKIPRFRDCRGRLFDFQKHLSRRLSIRSKIIDFEYQMAELTLGFSYSQVGQAGFGPWQRFSSGRFRTILNVEGCMGSECVHSHTKSHIVVDCDCVTVSLVRDCACVFTQLHNDCVSACDCVTATACLCRHVLCHTVT